jgi:hypothetical protein
MILPINYLSFYWADHITLFMFEAIVLRYLYFHLVGKRFLCCFISESMLLLLEGALIWWNTEKLL